MLCKTCSAAAGGGQHYSATSKSVETGPIANKNQLNHLFCIAVPQTPKCIKGGMPTSGGCLLHRHISMTCSGSPKNSNQQLHPARIVNQRYNETLALRPAALQARRNPDCSSHGQLLGLAGGCWSAAGGNRSSSSLCRSDRLRRQRWG